MILILYVWVAPAHIVDGDNAEFSALAGVGGTAHPSGYPLYVLWLRAWSWLPVSSPAHAAAIATAILAAAQIVILHAACRAWGARPVAATIAVGVFATAPIVMRFQTEAEVFALNGLACAAVLWLAASAGPLRGTRRLVMLGLVAGLGLSNHLTCVLVAPVGILGVVRGIRESERAWYLSLAFATGALVAGLLPYAYLLVTPETPVSWGQIDTVSELVRHFLRADYGGGGSLSARGGEVRVGTQLLELGRSIGASYLWLPAIIGLGTIGYLAARADRSERSERSESRVGAALFGASWLLAGPVLASRFNIDPGGTAVYIIQRFHLLPILLLAVPVAVGIDRLGSRLAERLPAPMRSSVVLHIALTVFGLLALTGRSLPQLARFHSPAVEQGLRNLLVSLPADAVVIGSTDEFHFGLGYLQALGERPDVAVITTPQLGLPHYRERVRRQTGIVVERVAPGSAQKVSVIVAEQIVATGRPLFIDPYQANIAGSFATYPFGLVFRVVPRGSTLPTVDELFVLNRDLFARYVFGYPVPGQDDQLAAQFHRHYARVWTILAEALGRAGRREDQMFALELARTLAPTP